MTDILFPPPPKTVEVLNPDGDLQPVQAYGHVQGKDPVQKVRWNPEHGYWEVDPITAVWRKVKRGDNSTNHWPWTLATAENQMARSDRASIRAIRARLDLVEARLAYLESQLGVQAESSDQESGAA